MQTGRDPRDDLDLYEFEGGFVLGLFFVEPAETLTDAQYLKALWMELKVHDPAAWKTRLLAFGALTRRFPQSDAFLLRCSRRPGLSPCADRRRASLGAVLPQDSGRICQFGLLLAQIGYAVVFQGSFNDIAPICMSSNLNVRVDQLRDFLRVPFD